MGSLPLLEVVLPTYLLLRKLHIGSCLRGARSDELIRVAMEPKTDLPKRLTFLAIDCTCHLPPATRVTHATKTIRQLQPPPTSSLETPLQYDGNYC